MNVNYTERVKQEREGYVLLQELSKQLESIIGPNAAKVTAEWDRTTDEKGRTRYTLGITNREDDASAAFTPEELRSTTGMWNRLFFLYDNLLNAKIQRHLQNLFAMNRAEK